MFFTVLQAFAGLDVSSLNASALLSVVMFHFCPNTQPWKLVVSRSRLLLCVGTLATNVG
jgi:hypothetical protein